MKTTVPYNLKKAMLFGAMVVFPFAFAGCGKENPTTDNGGTNSGGGTTTQPQKHNVELVYGNKPSTNWQHIELDIIQEYSNDPTVDTIFMIPDNYRQFSALSTSSLKNCVSQLRVRHNVNPNKVFGKEPFEVCGSSVQNNPENVDFLANIGP